MTFTAKAWKVVLISVNAKDGGEQGAIIMKTLLLDVMCRSYKAIRFVSVVVQMHTRAESKCFKTVDGGRCAPMTGG